MDATLPDLLAYMDTGLLAEHPEDLVDLLLLVFPLVC